MKKILLLFSLAFIVSGCGNTKPEIQPTITEIPQFTPTMEEATQTVGPTVIPAKNTPEPTPEPRERPRIIFYIGDGMGSAHRLAGQYFSKGEVRQLTMNSLPVSGWLVTDSFDGQLGESAAAASAMATGQLTNNEVVSVDIDGNPLKTILEYAQDLEMSVGLVSTKYITDSTTGAFAAHTETSSMLLEVASQLLDHQVDVIFGGGENDFLPIGVEGCYPKTGNRSDDRNLILEAEEAGYTIICDEEAFNLLDPKTDSLVLGLFADQNMTAPYSPSLASMTKTAIAILSENPNGFFLVVEGAMIDIASHFHESQKMIDDVIGLDDAVQVGLDLAEQDENTLLIVTADHETGGLNVRVSHTKEYGEDGPFYMPNGTEFFLRWTIGGHSNDHVPITAYGPGSEQFTGLHENTIVFDVMIDFLGIRITEE